MTSSSMPTKCQKLRPGGTYAGKQGFSYFEGIARETTGAQGICMHILRIPPGGRAKAHLHESHETAIYVMEGSAAMYWGEKLEHYMETDPGDLVYIPAGVPHLPINTGTVEAVAIIARTDPHEQESVRLLPELENLVPA
ncbi:cupin domain-containing protein [Shimia sp. R9_1]|uniref:cupin domain-containing protein n=1 Tax=Shimia sp. R9_1 TaxID=2821111 RepID=UPI001FFE09FD|nr:cupin domain-containing protein [Shimia sp. R9_1]